MMRFQKLLTIILIITAVDSLACTCPTRSIDKDADKAYDIVVGRVISATSKTLECSDYVPDVAFEFEVEFSYKEEVSDRITIFGGQGGGSCGGILHENYEYLVVVYKCDGGLYTTMCNDNAFLENASTQIEFLNEHFGKNYKASNFSFLTGTFLLSLVVIAGAGLTTFNYYRKGRTKKN
ncbi:hypothetical protein [Pseudochryseolinea flava]|uniref:CbiN domain protein n=1 Tax=Pseudochryseolinea flava TaxID=2059302 RepID=A0A364Y1J0_9BACT|nr:hypothetical protein [Pseudochryseolinea flava]RAV99966.1 hypothetical protein DQQ10_15495 [Pseudochryseolinea flava]